PHRIQRHVLHREGATFRTDDTDFVTSTDPDFHPTDVIEDSDGSMIFLDTGGWYVDACPLSKIHKVERSGAIYRVRKTGAPKINDPRGDALKLDTAAPADLAKHMADARPAVRERALELIVQKGEAAVAPLQTLRETAADAEVRCAAVFALGRVGGAAALRAARAALSDSDFQVRVAAARVAGSAKDKEAVERLNQIVVNDEPAARREAATALGRIGDTRATAALLAGAATARDRFIDHAITWSLIQLRDVKAMQTALGAAQPGTRRAALIALDQMDGSPLSRAQAIPHLEAADAELRRAALFVVSRHADWAAGVMDFLRARLRAPQFNAAEAESLGEALLAFSGDAQAQQLIAATLNDPGLDNERRMFLLETIERAAVKEFPASWTESLGAQLKAADVNVRSRAIAVIRARRVTGQDAALKQIAGNAAETTPLRVAALGALIAHGQKPDDGEFAFLLEALHTDREPDLRLAAALALGQAELSAAQLARMAGEYLPRADSLTLAPLLDAFRNAQDAPTGMALARALATPGANLNGIGLERLEKLFANYPSSVQAEVNPAMMRFRAEQSTRLQQMRDLEPLLEAGGDTGAGRRLFFGRVACATCHTIGREGGNIGPDLTSIGAIRSGHDILEAILFPSATFVPGHETRTVKMKNTGEIFSGVIAEGESGGDTLVLVSGPKSRLRLCRADIASIKPSETSLMPEGLVSTLSQKELGDLLAFLRAQK
ncbi:MAG: HEAT repeat domain-containing protein, partial [Blastocatellia bacterium]